MAFTYTRAETVAVGEVLDSRKHRLLARAFNDRFKLGPSLPWRLLFYFFNCFRQIRRDDGLFEFPSQAEFFEFYQGIEPGVAEWPLTGPGDPAGANLVSQLPIFVFGNASIELASESERTTNPVEGGLELNAGGGTAAELWELGKRQRGALDPTSGALGCPAFTAAVSHTQIRYSAASPHGVTYGDFLGGPEIIGTCVDPYPSDGETPLNYEVKFTKLDGSATLTYGSCPENPGDVAGVAVTAFAYVIFFYSGATLTLSNLEWIEGPYTANPALRKTQNNFLDRAINTFAREFIGGPQSVQETAGWNRRAFSFQEFLTSQYLLAPQLGGEGPDGVTDIYPKFTAGTLSPGDRLESGTVLQTIHAQPSHVIHASFTCASCFVQAAALFEPAEVEVLRNGTVLARVTLTPDAEHNAGAIAVFNRPAAGGTITVRLATEARFTNGAPSLTVELTELLTYLPNARDLYLVLRIGGVQFSGVTDGDGTRQTAAREIGTNYFTRGCITALGGHVALPGSLAQLNNNAVFDAARRLSKCVRIVPRWQFQGLALIGGKTVLYFQRGTRGSQTIDSFDGIAPARAAVTSIRHGRTYLVRGDHVLYNQQGYAPGQTFTGAAGVTTFSGAGTVWEQDGIRATAEPGGLSNRWLFGVELKAYREQESSIWKPSAYGDYYAFIDRCHFCSPEIADDSRVLLHMAYGQASGARAITAEAPDAFRYLPTPLSSAHYVHANDVDCTVGDVPCEEARADFYRSCRLFEPWPEVESVTDDGEGNLTVTLATRLHHHADADSSFTNDVATWDVTALRDESYRTLENGLREYLVWQHTGQNSSVKIGDQAANGDCQSLLDAPYGSVLPHFLFTQLVGEPYEDGNTRQERTDSPFFHDEFTRMELYLRAICEGFVDGVTSAELACGFNTTDAFGYTFEQLLIQSSDGGRYISPLASQATSRLRESDINPVRPVGHGPLPNTIASSEVFNIYATAINLLDTFRVMLPANLQMRTGNALSQRDVTATGELKNAQGEAVPPGGSTFALNAYSLYYEGAAASGGSMSFDAWADSTAATATATTYLTASLPLAVTLNTERGRVEYRWVGDDDSELALPDEFAGMLASAAGIIATVTRTVRTPVKTLVTGSTAGSQCHQVGLGPDANWENDLGGAILWTEDEQEAVTCEQMTGGVIESGEPPAGPVGIVDAFPDANPANNCSYASVRSTTIEVVNQTTPLITVPLETAA